MALDSSNTGGVMVIFKAATLTDKPTSNFPWKRCLGVAKS